MRNTSRIFRWFGGAALLVFAAQLAAMQPYSEKDLDPKNLARLEEQAKTPDDWRVLSDMWEHRANMLEEKAQRHEQLRERYAAGPKSLIAKRGQAWNTPKRQAFLAKKARSESIEARQTAEVFLARANSESAEVD